MASLGLFRKLAVDSDIRFGPITVVWNREHVSATLMDFIACLTAHARGLPAASVHMASVGSAPKGLMPRSKLKGAPIGRSPP